ncbi:MAG: thiamine phosphate synthase [Phycisphaeraceae bacterium]|nr:thiamine phosphate synthase [Phycisphaeraceae bacterium]
MPALARVVDANSNRAREALRVLEDLARLRLDHSELSRSFKKLRHDLTGCLGQLPIDRATLLAWRNTAGDVGAQDSGIVLPGRESESAVASAASSRLGESLRVLEESSKAIRGALPVAAAIERIRYQAYDLCRDLELALMGGRGPQWTLCVLITESLCVHHRWEEVARRAIDGGADCLQLREKGIADRELLGRARTLVEFAHKQAAAVVINDRPDIAILAGADGVHIGQSDLSINDVRRIAGGSLRIGVSCATIEDARLAVREGADVCGLGPMFVSSTKAKPALSGPALIAQYIADEATRRVPHLAISGITQANVAQLVGAGCQGIATSAAVCGSPNPEEVCRGLSRAIKGLADVG